MSTVQALQELKENEECPGCDEKTNADVETVERQPCENCGDEAEEELPIQKLSASEKDQESEPPCENCGKENLGEPSLEQENTQQEPEKIQRAPTAHANGSEKTSAPASVSVSSAVTHSGMGSPLAPSVQGALEPGLGVDLSGVRVHADQSANKVAQSLKARAFTHGQDIWLGPGEFTQRYAPDGA